MELTEYEKKEIETKVNGKLGEFHKNNRVISKELWNIVEKEATLIKYPIEDDELCAFVCKKKEKTFVYINTHIPEDKQLFAAAHELYHIWFDQDVLNKPEILKKDTLENSDMNYRELKANYFAAAFLVPREVLENELRSREIKATSIQLEDIVRLMSLFLVPYKTIVRRLFEIEFIDRKLLNHFLSIPDRDPNKGVMPTIKRLQIKDIPQEGNKEMFFEDLINNAIIAFESGKISEKRLRDHLSLVNHTPEEFALDLDNERIDEQELEELIMEEEVEND